MSDAMEIWRYDAPGNWTARMFVGDDGVQLDIITGSRLTLTLPFTEARDLVILLRDALEAKLERAPCGCREFAFFNLKNGRNRLIVHPRVNEGVPPALWCEEHGWVSVTDAQFTYYEGLRR